MDLTSIDFNTIIANFEKTAALKAEECRKEAASIRSRGSTGWAAMDAQQEVQAKEEDAKAAAWS